MFDTYVAHLIIMRTNLIGFNKHEFSVHCCFKYVITLSNQLTKSYRGSQVIQKQPFIKKKRILFKKYLKRFVGHLVIKKND
ncbi:hypothetical protein SADUNF_Sadunf13G0118300 [Salix dunnii]|uniref:Uncharacterized protein n=1 Tax=Salix dunnii TaxID=1413687 RepID=A0A835MRN3_9ROSI|nr:hypothetical protein SADUNF_Sadunf13G0118300 [Salix dunnii]